MIWDWCGGKALRALLAQNRLTFEIPTHSHWLQCHRLQILNQQGQKTVKMLPQRILNLSSCSILNRFQVKMVMQICFLPLNFEMQIHWLCERTGNALPLCHWWTLPLPPLAKWPEANSPSALTETSFFTTLLLCPQAHFTPFPKILTMQWSNPSGLFPKGECSWSIRLDLTLPTSSAQPQQIFPTVYG